jgi:hypothetical protein
VSKELPSRDYIASILEYDPASGHLRWIKARKGIRVGDIAGTVNPHGYLRITIDGRPYQAHRVVWLMANGAWPDDVIDHINGIGTDNRITNLRACTQSENRMNSKVGRNSKSGVKGVTWRKAISAWEVNVGIGGRAVFAGFYENLSDAKKAAMDLRMRLHGEFANHGDRESATSAG